jgi:hypothetical protein
VYETKRLYDYCSSEYNDGWRAKKRAETFIKGALDRWGYTVNFEDTTDHIPNPGSEKRDEEFYDDCDLCDPNGLEYKYKVLGWFKEWVECGRPAGDQSSILLSSTSTSNGGKAYRSGKYAHATTGRFVANLSSSYEKYGLNSKDDGFNTVIHELGHNFMQNTNFDSDDDGEDHHDVATYYSRDDWWTQTAMSVEGSSNECGDPERSTGGWEHTWSSCCHDKWNVSL